MLTIYVNGSKQDIVVAVQKSGFTWALNRDNGSLVWSTVLFLSLNISFIFEENE
jgi:outer membrane protein assembly factor BamB